MWAPTNVQPSPERLGKIIRIHNECEGEIEKSILMITISHHFTRLAEWWQTVIPRDGFFYPTLTQIMDSFSCSPLTLLCPRHDNYAPAMTRGIKSLNTLRCNITWWCHWLNIDVTWWPYRWDSIQPMNSPLVTAWVRYKFLCQGKISDVRIRCASYEFLFLAKNSDILLGHARMSVLLGLMKESSRGACIAHIQSWF